MTLVLLVPGLLMGGGDGSAPSAPANMSAVHFKRGVWQPDVPTVTGPGMGG